MSKPIQMWRCDECLECHEDEDEAAECCRPTVSEVFVCPTCGSVSTDEQEAIQCCDEETGEPHIRDGKKFPPNGDKMTPAEYVAAYREMNTPKGVEA